MAKRSREMAKHTREMAIRTREMAIRTREPALRAQTADSERATYAVLLLHCRAGP
jgi:hypothetical protein